jgi:hypothetical protein
MPAFTSSPTFYRLSLWAGILLSPMMALSQATSSLLIPVTNQTVQMLAGNNAQIDLLKEARKLKPALNSVSNIEIQMLRLEAKSNVGGAQVFLKINNGFVASAVVETNPDQFLSSDPRSFERFELKNIDRTRISTASLQIQNIKSLRMKSLEIIFGSVQEATVFGNYATQQINQVGGALLNDNRDVRPSRSAVSTIMANYYQAENEFDEIENTDDSTPVAAPYPSRPVVMAKAPVQSVAKAPAAKPAVAANRCIRDYRGSNYCIGDIVENAWGFAQTIIAVNPKRNEVTLVSDMYEQPYARHVDMLKK